MTNRLKKIVAELLMFMLSAQVFSGVAMAIDEIEIANGVSASQTKTDEINRLSSLLEEQSTESQDAITQRLDLLGVELSEDITLRQEENKYFLEGYPYGLEIADNEMKLFVVVDDNFTLEGDFTIPFSTEREHIFEDNRILTKDFLENIDKLVRIEREGVYTEYYLKNDQAIIPAGEITLSTSLELEIDENTGELIAKNAEGEVVFVQTAPIYEDENNRIEGSYELTKIEQTQETPTEEIPAVEEIAPIANVCGIYYKRAFNDVVYKGDFISDITDQQACFEYLKSNYLSQDYCGQDRAETAMVAFLSAEKANVAGLPADFDMENDLITMFECKLPELTEEQEQQALETAQQEMIEDAEAQAEEEETATEQPVETTESTDTETSEDTESTETATEPESTPEESESTATEQPVETTESTETSEDTESTETATEPAAEETPAQPAEQPAEQPTEPAVEETPAQPAEQPAETPVSEPAEPETSEESESTETATEPETSEDVITEITSWIIPTAQAEETDTEEPTEELEQPAEPAPVAITEVKNPEVAAAIINAIEEFETPAVEEIIEEPTEIPTEETAVETPAEEPIKIPTEEVAPEQETVADMVQAIEEFEAPSESEQPEEITPEDTDTEEEEEESEDVAEIILDENTTETTAVEDTETQTEEPAESTDTATEPETPVVEKIEQPTETEPTEEPKNIYTLKTNFDFSEDIELTYPARIVSMTGFMPKITIVEKEESKKFVEETAEDMMDAIEDFENPTDEETVTTEENIAETPEEEIPAEEEETEKTPEELMLEALESEIPDTVTEEEIPAEEEETEEEIANTFTCENVVGYAKVFGAIDSAQEQYLGVKYTADTATTGKAIVETSKREMTVDVVDTLQNSEGVLASALAETNESKNELNTKVDHFLVDNFSDEMVVNSEVADELTASLQGNSEKMNGNEFETLVDINSEDIFDRDFVKLETVFSEGTGVSKEIKIQDGTTEKSLVSTLRNADGFCQSTYSAEQGDTKVYSSASDIITYTQKQDGNEIALKEWTYAVKPNSGAGSVYEWEMTSPRGNAITMRQSEEGGVEIYENSNGVDQFMIAIEAPFYFTAQGEKKTTQYEINGNILTLAINESVESYPLLIDPTYTYGARSVGITFGTEYMSGTITSPATISTTGGYAAQGINVSAASIDDMQYTMPAASKSQGSIAIWVRPSYASSTLLTDYTVFDSVNKRLYYDDTTDSWKFVVNTAGGWKTAEVADTFSANSRIYLVGTYDNANVSLTVDASASNTVASDVVVSTDSTMSIGRQDNNAGYEFTNVSNLPGGMLRRSYATTEMNGCTYLAGGYSGTAVMNDVWRSCNAGASWTQMTSAFSPSGYGRYDQSMYTFNGKLYMAGGNYYYSNGTYIYYTDVLESSNGGVSWTIKNNTAFPTGWAASPATIWNGKVLLVGGYDKDYSRDWVWSSTDGINFTKNINAGFGTRAGHAVYGLNNNRAGAKLFLTGGYDADSTSYKNDVWSSTNGLTWTLVNANAGYPIRTEARAATMDGYVWLAGGSTDNGQTVYNDVWVSTDGINFGPYSFNGLGEPRRGFQPAVTSSGLLVTGGRGASPADVNTSMQRRMDSTSFAGVVAEPILFNQPLLPAEIIELYNRSTSPTGASGTVINIVGQPNFTSVAPEGTTEDSGSNVTITADYTIKTTGIGGGNYFRVNGLDCAGATFSTTQASCTINNISAGNYDVEVKIFDQADGWGVAAWSFDSDIAVNIVSPIADGSSIYRASTDTIPVEIAYADLSAGSGGIDVAASSIVIKDSADNVDYTCTNGVDASYTDTSMTCTVPAATLTPDTYTVTTITTANNTETVTRTWGFGVDDNPVLDYTKQYPATDAVFEGIAPPTEVKIGYIQGPSAMVPASSTIMLTRTHDGAIVNCDTLTDDTANQTLVCALPALGLGEYTVSGNIKNQYAVDNALAGTTITPWKFLIDEKVRFTYKYPNVEQYMYGGVDKVETRYESYSTVQPMLSNLAVQTIGGVDTGVFCNITTTETICDLDGQGIDLPMGKYQVVGSIRNGFGDNIIAAGDWTFYVDKPEMTIIQTQPAVLEGLVNENDATSGDTDTLIQIQTYGSGDIDIKFNANSGDTFGGRLHSVITNQNFPWSTTNGEWVNVMADDATSSSGAQCLGGSCNAMSPNFVLNTSPQTIITKTSNPQATIQTFTYRVRKSIQIPATQAAGRYEQNLMFDANFSN